MITRAVCRILVGREEELSSLEDALLAACRGEGSVVVLAGDAGIGKSRLCAELATRAERIGATVMEGSCSEADLALPYLPFLEAIGNHLSAVGTAELRERLGVHVRELAKVFPQLAEDSPANNETESPDGRLRLFEAILALLGLASAERGLLLIVEDLHWADASTRELLDYLTRRLRNRRLLVLATYRRDEMHRKHPLLPTVQGWQRSRLAQVVELEPLAPEGVARMVSSIFDNTNVGEEFRDFMHARSEGNPFVLEEMLKAAIDRGDIYRDEADWQRKPIAELRIPGTVRDTILLRVERLDAGQAEILRCAAILGRSFDYQTLIRLSEQNRGAVETALQTAVQQQLLEEEAGSQNRYRFRHALTQEAIYEDLSAPTRERLHSAAADVLAERLETPKAEVAFHLRHANRWQEAIQVTMEAAAAAEATLGYGEAAALYSLLLPVVTTGIDRARLLCRLGEAYWLMGTSGRAVEPLEEGVRLLEQGGQPLEAARHRLTLGRCHWERSDPGRGRAEYERALQELEPAGPSRELALAYIRLAGLHVFNLKAKPARELAEKAISTASAADADDMRIWALNFLGVAVAYDGDYATGIELLERSANEALERGLYNIAGNALHNLFAMYYSNMQMEKLGGLISRLEAIKLEHWGTLSRLFVTSVWAHQNGDIPGALRASLELLAHARALGEVAVERLAHTGLALNYVELAQYHMAREHLVRPNAESEAQDALSDAWLWIRFHLATDDAPRALEAAEFLLTVALPAENDDGAVAAVEAFLAAGRFQDAERMLAELDAAPQPIARHAANLARAHIALVGGDAATARAGVEEAVTSFQTAGMVLRELDARLLLAEIHLNEDDARAAESEFRIILDAGRRRDLRRLARKAEEGLAGLGIVVDAPAPEHRESFHAPTELGERLVTVMFADVRGYTAIVGGRTPAETVDLVSTYQRWAALEVERHLGVVDKFAGDAVMATFNISGNQVDHAAHALQAALALRDKAFVLGLPVGIGIATGSAVVGTLKTGANLSVIGDTTNLAARLQAQAAAGEVLLSEESYRRLRDNVDAAPEQLDLKGFDHSVVTYRLSAPATFVSRPSEG
ncbi:MAG: AAA family ATPase [Candidatus Dormibacteraeota bacterium]|nr:AAA family ATPase [Candidatus Dormibacteraeota bacterium]